MPLPDEYFNLLNKGRGSGVNTFSGIGTPMDRPRPLFDQYELTEPPAPPGEFGDIFEGAAKGFVSGVSWGAVDLEERDWEEMNSMERTGWVLGEGASLFVPYGPFSLIGKGGRALTRAFGNQFVGDIAGKAVNLSSKQADQLLKGVNAVAKKTIKPGQEIGTRVDEVINGLDPELVRGLKNVLDDDNAIRWVNELGIAGNESTRAYNLLRNDANIALGKAFKEFGIPTVPAQTDFMARKFVDELATGGPHGGGRYVNDVAEWIERGIGQRIPEKAAKYLGMAAQDMAMMSIHSVGSGKIKEHLHGEEFDTGTALGHSAMMSLAFPLIRAIPNLPKMGSAGAESLGTGMKAYWRKYNQVNYERFAEKYGEQTTRDMLKVMLRGNKIDLVNQSKLQGFWKKEPLRKGQKTLSKDYTGRDLLYGDKIDKMPIDDVKTLLTRFQGEVSGEMSRMWGGRYVMDLIGSLPRMGLGILAMNEGLFRTGAFKDMDGQELAAHLFISAVMTKGQGAWGKDTARRHLADYTPYYDALKLLGAKPEVLQNRLKFYHDKDNSEFMGASFATTQAGSKIEETFDFVMGKDGGPSETFKSSEFNVSKHKNVERLGNIWNLIKGHRDPDRSPVDMKKIGKAKLDELSIMLNKIEIKPGQTIGDMQWPAVEVALTSDSARGIHRLYGAMFNDLREKMGLPVWYRPPATEGEYGTIEYKPLSAPSGIRYDIGTLMQFNSTLSRLSSMGKAVKIDERVPVRELGKDLETLQVQFKDITDSWMDKLDAEYGNRKIYEAVDDNMYMNFFNRASNIEAADFMYKVMSNDPTSREAENLRATLDNLFNVRDSDNRIKYRQSIQDYSNFVEKKKGDKDQEQQVYENLELLGPMFDLIKAHTGKGVAMDPGKTAPINPADLQIAAETFATVFNKLPQEVRDNFYATGYKEIIKRNFSELALNPRTIYASKIAVEEGYGLWNERDMRLHVPSNESIKMMDEYKHLSPNKRKEVLDANNRIRAAFGGEEGGLIVHDTFIPTDTKHPDFRNLELKSIIAVDKALGDSKMRDLLENTGDALQKMSYEDSALQKKLTVVRDDVMKTLDNLTTLGKGDTKILDRIASELETLREMGMTATDRAAIELELGNMRGFLEKGSTLSEVDIEKYTESVNNVGEIVLNTFREEHIGRQEVAEVTNRIYNMANLGPHSGGLAPHQAQKLVENLSVKLHELLKGKNSREEKKELSEMILDYNENGSWIKARKIIQAVNQQGISMVLAHSRNPIFSERAKEIWETSHENSVIDHKNKTLQSIGEKYGLQDKSDPNEIDSAFIELVRGDGSGSPEDMRSVQKASNLIRRRIKEKTEGDTAEYTRLWDSFLREDAGPLFSSILNGRLRQTAKMKAGVLEHDMGHKFRTTPNDVFFDRTHVHGIIDPINSEDRYNITYLDDSITIKTHYGHRTISLDAWPAAETNKAVIQNTIDESFRSNKLARDANQKISEYGHKFSPKDLKEMGSMPMAPYVYMRLSPGTRILFEASKNNIKTLNSDFGQWYANKLKSLQDLNLDVEAKNFRQLFGHLVSSADTNSNLNLKMLVQHVDFTRTGQFDKWLGEYSRTDSDSNKLAKIEADLYKRGYLSDGGTTQKDHPKLRQYFADNHPDAIVRNKAIDLELREGKFGTVYVNDETFKDLAMDPQGSPFDIRRILTEDLNARMPAAGVNDVLRAGMQIQLAKIQGGTLPSLENSLLDGAKIASEGYAKYLFAQKGGEGWNGAKTIIFATGDNSTLGKGFLIYLPGVSDKMPANVDLLIGDSSAKAKAGISRDGNPIESYVHNVPANRRAGSWADDLFTKISDRNIMDLNAEGVGVQFTSKNVEGVNISSSMFDLQSSTHLRSARDWMGIDNILDTIAKTNTFKEHGENNELARLLFSAKEKEGLFYTEGALGLTKKLVMMGMTSSNPMIKPQVGRMIRNDDFSKLRSIPTRYGEDNFIIPDWDGSLAMPVIRELYTSPDYMYEGKFRPEKRVAAPTITDPMSLELHRRAVMQIGEMAVSHHTASRLFQDGLYKHERRTFIARDANGVDHTVQLVGGKFDFSAPFYEAYDSRYHTIKNVSPTQAMDMTSFNQNRTATEQVFKDNVSSLIQKVFDKSNKHDFTFGEVHDYINGLEIQRDGHTNIKLTTADKDLAKKLNLALGFSNNAVPKIAKDQPTMRVKRINGDEMNGLVQVNNYDLRVTLQRDNDGDHLYTYMDVPHDMLKDYQADMGHIQDYDMFKKEINRSDINIFGIGMDGKAGQNPNQIGFQDYAMQIAAQRKAIGSIISTRRILHWMNDAHLKYNDQPYVRDFTDKTDSISGINQQPVERMAVVNQNAVDVFGGTAKVTSPKAIEHFFIKGELPEGFKPAPGSLEERLANGPSFFTSKEYGKSKNKEIELEIFKIISNTMRKANSISNDVWDEAGSRAPEPFDLKRDYNNLKRLHNDPNGYIVRELLKSENRLRKSGDSGSADVLRDQIIEMFYQDKLQGATYAEKIEDFRSIIMSGKYIAPTTKPFRFDTKGKDPIDRLDNFFNGTMGSHSLHKLITSKAYWQQDAGDLESAYHKEAGRMVDKVTERVMFARALGNDPVKEYDNFKLPEFIQDPEKVYGGEVRKSITRGVARTILQKQHRDLQNSLEYFSEEKFVNPTKLEKLEERINTVKSVIDIIDKKAAKDMVISKDGQIQIRDQQKARRVKKEKLKRPAFVYELRGPITPKAKKWKDEGLTIADLSWGENRDVDIDYGHLKNIGWFQKGDMLKLLPGRVYVIDRKPMVRESMAKDESMYNEAWKNVTGVGRMTSEHIIPGDPAMRDQFVQDTMELRQSMDRSYRKTLGILKRDKTHKGDVFEYVSARDMSSINEYFDKWVNLVEGGKSRTEQVHILMKYLLQPQVQTGKYLFNGTDDIPYYRHNRNLTNKVFNWALEHKHQYGKIGLESYIKKMVQNLEKIARGERYEIDHKIDGYKRMYVDKYDWGQFGKNADLARSLLGSYWFDTPMLSQLPGYHNYNVASYGQIETARDVSGDKIKIRQKLPKTFEIDGGCL